MRTPDLIIPWPAHRQARETGASRSEEPTPRSRVLAGPQAAPSTEASRKLAELDRASRTFESLLYKEMIHAMVSGSTEGGFFGEATGGDTWEELLESGLSDSLGRSGHLGLAKQIYRQYEGTVRRQAEADTVAPLAPTAEKLR